ncbi:Protein mono-ADP-ribosyltransferase PARP8 [Pseudocercospora fuligena]|uniref:Protein mono-ADP-ribosyltransferase PARP8 n=1 Tax=Pseudocercospora fuligena TaxID=685502 RepID=A0A8H6VBY1_9PEZI|nr:Protein mono-ADP-ribosyltransferase PARP8 [Pseudocercospora fuligena]
MLRRSLSKISLSDKNDHKRWTKDINRTAFGQKPIPDSNSLAAFPIYQLRHITDSHLKKRHLSQQELDGLCCDLINGHDDRIVALASCSQKLSKAALYRLLEAFASDTRDPTAYPQAFTAAYYDAEDDATCNNRSWAQFLVAVSKYPQAQSPYPDTLRLLFAQYRRATPPSDGHIADRAQIVTHTICEKLRLALSTFQDSRDWTKAAPLADVLSEQLSALAQRHAAASRAHHLLDASVPGWRSWAQWRIKRERIDQWKDLEHDEQFSPLWALIGPDFQLGGRLHDSLLSRLVDEKIFDTWLESHDFATGNDFCFDDSSQMFARFASTLTHVLDDMCRQRGMSEHFLRLLCRDRRRGLDEESLDIWRLATMSLFPKAPQFSAILLGNALPERGIVPVVDQGCAILNGLEKLKRYFLEDIELILTAVGGQLLTLFCHNLQSHHDWQESATEVLRFRQLPRRWPWLQALKIQIEGMALDCGQMLSQDHLATLSGLHDSIIRHPSQLEQAAVIYISQLICGTTPANDSSMRILERLHLLWLSQPSSASRESALLIANLDQLPGAVRLHCLEGLLELRGPAAQCVLEAITGTADDVGENLRCFVGYVAKLVRSTPNSCPSWKILVQHVLSTQGTSSFDLSVFSSCSFSAYDRLVQDLTAILGSDIMAERKSWMKKIAPFSKTLDSIRVLFNGKAAVHSMMTAASGSKASHAIAILGCLNSERNSSRKRLMETVVVQLSDSTGNFEVTLNAMKSIAAVPKPGLALCEQLVALVKQESARVAAVQVNVWLQRPELDPVTHKCLMSFAKALRLPEFKPEDARKFFGKAIASIMQRATKVDGMAIAVRQGDRVGVKNLFTRLGVDQLTTPIQELMEDLDPTLLSNIEEIDDVTVNLHFSLSHFNDLRQAAMGLKKGDSLSIRLTTDQCGGWNSFCVHVAGPHQSPSGTGHKPYMTTYDALPNRSLCRSQITRMEYVMTNAVWQALRPERLGTASLETVYKFVKKTIHSFGNNCVVCQNTLVSDRYRPTLCSAPSCFNRYLQSNVHLRLLDLINDAPAVTVLLSAIFAAVHTMTSNNRSMELLPGRPSRLSNNPALLQTMNAVPQFGSASARPGNFTTNVELVFSWACNHYAGFLVSAAGPQRIPNLPGVHQFVLVDNAPDVAASFDRHAHLMPRQVLFHGTTLDRLYAIFTQGLKVLSHTPLQQHGAASGAGIYLAEDPSTSMAYARPMALAGNFATKFNDYTSRGVLLAVECAGVSPGRGVHVEPDPSKVLLRYVFLTPPGWVPPQRAHIEPALSSNFNSLRLGARKN